ncbi:hypothetical protein JCM8097_004911 [Rhodosporidiobolus ruineniae]
MTPVRQADLRRRPSPPTFAAELEKRPFDADGIDSLVNNAGINASGWKTLTESPTAELREVLETNLFGAIWATKALLPLLRKGKGKQLLFMSSYAGSKGGQVSALPIVDAISKVALNMAAIKFAKELEPEGFVTEIDKPGEPEATDEVEDAVAASLKNLFLKPLTKEDNAKLYNYDGTEIPW